MISFVYISFVYYIWHPQEALKYIENVKRTFGSYNVDQWPTDFDPSYMDAYLKKIIPTYEPPMKMVSTLDQQPHAVTQPFHRIEYNVDVTGAKIPVDEPRRIDSLLNK